MALMDMDKPELEALMKESGQPAFRAGQLFSWLAKGAEWEEMSNLPLALRGQLARRPPGFRAEARRFTAGLFRAWTAPANISFAWRTAIL